MYIHHTRSRVRTKKTFRMGSKTDKLIKKAEALDATKVSLPYTLCSGVTVEEYNKFLARDHPFGGKTEFDPRTNSVLLVEMPGKPHEAAERQFTLAIMTTPTVGPMLDCLGSATIESSVAGNPSLESDACFLPIGLAPPANITQQNFITLVVEIGHSVRMGQLENKANRWLAETSCREVVIFKLSPSAHKLRARVYQAGAVNPVQSLNFGGGHCTALGQQILQLSTASLFAGVANVPVAVTAAYPGGTFDVDLFPVKQAILRHI